MFIIQSTIQFYNLSRTVVFQFRSFMGSTVLCCLRLYGGSGEYGEGKDRLISWLGKQSPVLYNTNSGKHHFTFFYKI